MGKQRMNLFHRFTGSPALRFIKVKEDILLERKFKIILIWDAEEEAFNVTVPALPGCVTYGKTRDEAIKRAQGAIAGFLEAMDISKMNFPEDVVEVVEVEVSYG